MRFRAKDATLPSCVRICYSPGSTFNCLKVRRRWLLTFSVYSVALVVIAFIQYPEILKGVLHSTAENPERMQLMLLPLRRILTISLLCIPLLEFAKAAFLAVILLAFCLLSGVHDAQLRTAMVAVCHCRMVLILKAAYNSLLLSVYGVHGKGGSAVQDLTGINVFFDAQKVGATLYTVLAEIGIFSLWYLCLLILAVSVMFDIPKGRAAVISSLILALTVAAKIVVSSLSGSGM